MPCSAEHQLRNTVPYKDNNNTEQIKPKLCSCFRCTSGCSNLPTKICTFTSETSVKKSQSNFSFEIVKPVGKKSVCKANQNTTRNV